MNRHYFIFIKIVLKLFKNKSRVSSKNGQNFFFLSRTLIKLFRKNNFSLKIFISRKSLKWKFVFTNILSKTKLIELEIWKNAEWTFERFLFIQKTHLEHEQVDNDDALTEFWDVRRTIIDVKFFYCKFLLTGRFVVCETSRRIKPGKMFAGDDQSNNFFLFTLNT